jgi:hypothetical protein
VEVPRCTAAAQETSCAGFEKARLAHAAKSLVGETILKGHGFHPCGEFFVSDAPVRL